MSRKQPDILPEKRIRYRGSVEVVLLLAYDVEAQDPTEAMAKTKTLAESFANHVDTFAGDLLGADIVNLHAYPDPGGAE